MTLNRKPQAGALNRSASEQAHWSMLFLHVILTMLLVRIWAWVSAKDGSMIWDEGPRTALHSVQRILASVQRFLDRDAETSS